MPVLIEDFPDDDPRSQPDPCWEPPLRPSVITDCSAAASLAHWLWDETAIDAAIHAVRAELLNSDDRRSS